MTLPLALGSVPPGWISTWRFIGNYVVLLYITIHLYNYAHIADCGPPPGSEDSTLNVEVSQPSASHSMTGVLSANEGSAATYSCDRGFMLEGTSMLTCEATDGGIRWSSADSPSCVESKDGLGQRLGCIATMRHLRHLPPRYFWLIILVHACIQESGHVVSLPPLFKWPWEVCMGM